ncbi:MAG TPA: DUF4038 domain-containing protein, partial [Stellaceae bacterium]|nr:DUF4038 domain-containing protein [Stellaceae bacterium]
MNRRTLPLVVAAVLAAAVAGGAAADPAFPLKPSANNRYLVDQNDVPFLMAGDAPQSLIGNLSLAQARKFLKNRRKYGVNALWVNLLCDSYTACNSDGTTFDGIAPFTVPGDLSTPNEAYFARVDAMLELAASYGMVVLLDPIETGGWLQTLRDNGIGKARAYGRYLGSRYKDVANIIWMHGNDFQSWRDPGDNDLVIAVGKGIRDTDANHIQTAELDYLVSATLDDRKMRKLVALDAVYTYRPTYAKILQEYQRRHFAPIFMVEANYEFEHNGGTDGGSTQNLRRQEYWTLLSGATGQLYGSAYSWTFQSGWQDNLDTPGILQFSYANQLLGARRWYDLVPDRAHRVLTQGFGTFSEDDPIPDDTYATAAATADGTLALAYLPSVREVTIDMTTFSGPVVAQWFDPTDNSFITIDPAPVAN